MVDMWMPGATRHAVGNTGAMSGGPARAVWHITSNASDWTFANELGWFTGGGQDVAPHLLWDPFTGEIAQFFPADSRSLSLENDGAVKTNRTGKYCVQIEVVFTEGETVNGKRYATVRDTPCKGLDRIVAWLRSLGIPDTWPGGSPTGFVRDTVSLATWTGRGGHYGHNQIPGNHHVDPGPMPSLFGAGPSPSPKPSPSGPARYQVVINGLAYGYGAHGDHVTEVGRALAAKGFGRHYTVGPGPSWSDADTENYSDFQESLGYSGTAPHEDADGVPGATTLKKLLGHLPAAPASKPSVSLAHIVYAAQHDPAASQGHTSHKAEVLLVEKALHAEGLLAAQWVDGSFGSKTVTAYAAWQRSTAGGSYSGSDANGIPGSASLKRLAARHGFTVTS